MERIEIPVISLGGKVECEDYEAHEIELGRKVGEACSEYGFFYINDHGIDAEFIEEVFEYSKLFFNLPQIEKDRISTSTNRHYRGYTRIGEETLDPTVQKMGDTKEGFYISREEPSHDTIRFYGPNVWPTVELCPSWNESLCKKFEYVMMKYHMLCELVAVRIVRLLSYALYQDFYRFDSVIQKPMSFVRLLHYSSQMSSESEGILACGSHSDYGLITLLQTDSNPGLQIFYKNTQWMNVEPKLNSFIVNIGDMTELLSLGRFKSTMHRVLNERGVERYSIPFFFDPDYNAVMNPIDSDKKDRITQNQSFKAGEYLSSKYSKTHADFSMN